MKNISIIKITVSLLVLLAFTSCEKEAGEGGNATIYGKVWVRDWNANFTSLVGEYFGTDEDVYIIYGTDKTYGNRVRTGPDGLYEFKYLRPGKYKIYAYAKDSANATNNQLLPIYKEVVISDSDTEVDAGTITVQR